MQDECERTLKILVSKFSFSLKSEELCCNEGFIRSKTLM